MHRYAGQQLLRSEIALPNDLIDRLVKRGDVEVTSSFIKGKTMRCRRCGTDDHHLLAQHYCARCQKACTYCRHCLRLGKVRECEPLYRFPPGRAPKIKQSLRWDGTLTDAQQIAADAVTEAVKNKTSLLIWAVTGAGKTEIVFQALEFAFSEGMRCLLATPRVDVVKELYPRFERSFPSISIAARYGGSRLIDEYAQLIIATTHQVMRYFRAFDVVIVDEVDAFPYSYDRSLQYAVNQAKKANAALIYLTATPNRPLLRDVDSIVKIPVRFHGYPLPVPRFSWCGNWKKALEKNKLPRRIFNWLRAQRDKNVPVLFFVPTLSSLKTISPILKERGFFHATVHADDEKRHEKIAAFRNRQLPLLVTTTILERGVTIPNVQVAVLGAEHDVFDEAALVQIAGRAGRAKQFPTGDVVFFHYGITKAMKAAKRHIETMNQEGERH